MSGADNAGPPSQSLEAARSRLSRAAADFFVRAGRPPRIALVGMPGSGKSRLFNRLVGADVSPVSNQGYTTQRAVSAVAEILSDYPDVPLVSYLPNLGWLDDDQAQPYLEAFRELILPATEVLVGNHKTLTDFLLPDWDSERPASARELAVAAGERGTRFVLVTGIMLPTKGGKGGKGAAGTPGEQFIDNVLASAQGALTGEKFEMFETGFVGAGDTLSAALAALLASGAELQAAVGEALAFMDQTLDAGFRPGMGSVVPDRFFWALPPAEEGEPGADGEPGPTDLPDTDPPETKGKPAPRRVH